MMHMPELIGTFIGDQNRLVVIKYEAWVLIFGQLQFTNHSWLSECRGQIINSIATYDTLKTIVKTICETTNKVMACCFVGIICWAIHLYKC